VKIEDVPYNDNEDPLKMEFIHKPYLLNYSAAIKNYRY
jgi:hypothetical protein